VPTFYWKIVKKPISPFSFFNISFPFLSEFDMNLKIKPEFYISLLQSLASDIISPKHEIFCSWIHIGGVEWKIAVSRSKQNIKVPR